MIGELVGDPKESPLHMGASLLERKQDKAFYLVLCQVSGYKPAVALWPSFQKAESVGWGWILDPFLSTVRSRLKAKLDNLRSTKSSWSLVNNKTIKFESKGELSTARGTEFHLFSRPQENWGHLGKIKVFKIKYNDL